MEMVSDQICLYDLQNFSTVVISVGGNDVSNGSDLEYVEERFDQLIVQIRNRNPDCKIFLCTSCPRNDCDVSELNSLLSSLCREHSIQVVEMEKHFCSQEGTPVLRYYGRDKIHLSKSGVRRFLDSIEKTCENLSLIDNFELSMASQEQDRTPSIGKLYLKMEEKTNQIKEDIQGKREVL